MSPSPLPERLPFSAVPDVALLVETDELLDRLAARAPRGVDLDDPVLASLAVLAGDVDLDPAPFEPTRRVARGYGLRVEDHPGPTRLGPAALEPPTQPLAILAQEVEARPASGAPATLGPRRAARAREQAHDGRRTAGLPPVQVPEQPSRAAGRVWQPAQGPTDSPPRRSWDPRTTIRAVPALAAAGAALVLSMSAAAALTSGESVNPATALAQVVRQIAGEPAEQSPPGSTGRVAGQVADDGAPGPSAPAAVTVAPPPSAVIVGESDGVVLPPASPAEAGSSTGSAVDSEGSRALSTHRHVPGPTLATGAPAGGGAETTAAGPTASVPPAPLIPNPETEAPPTWPSVPEETPSASASASPSEPTASDAASVTVSPAVVDAMHLDAVPIGPQGLDAEQDAGQDAPPGPHGAPAPASSAN